MVLTTVDSAAYSATQAPCGPVHINCPFREPLEDCPKEWNINCLRGLDLWLSNAGPYTRYIKMQHCCSCNDYNNGQVAEVLEVMQRAKQGLLLIGGIHTEDEIWAALLLAKHLFWPVVTDILSGLRLRRLFASCTEAEDRFCFIDHLDNALLSNAVKGWAQPDVIVQVCFLHLNLFVLLLFHHVSLLHKLAFEHVLIMIYTHLSRYLQLFTKSPS